MPTPGEPAELGRMIDAVRRLGMIGKKLIEESAFSEGVGFK